MDAKQLNKIMKLYYSQTLKALWDDQGKIKIVGCPGLKGSNWDKCLFQLVIKNELLNLFLEAFTMNPRITFHQTLFSGCVRKITIKPNKMRLKNITSVTVLLSHNGRQIILSFQPVSIKPH